MTYQTAHNDEALTRTIDEYAVAAQNVAQLREAYMLLKNAVGQDHVATKAAWNVYINRDACLHTIAVKLGQMSMRRQVDDMTATEFNSFCSNNG